MKLPWEGTDIPLDAGGWQAIGPSAVRLRADAAGAA